MAKRSIFTTKQLLFVVFIGCAMLANHFNLYLLFDIKFQFAAVFYLALIRLVGYKEALAGIIIVTLFNYFSKSTLDLYAMFSALEVLVVGWLYRWKRKNLLVWDVCFWAFLLGTVYLFDFGNVIGVNHELLLTLLLLQVFINSIVNALLADILSDYLPRLPKLRRLFPKKEPLYFGRIISQLAIAASILPLFCFMVIYGRYVEVQITKEVEKEISAVSERVDEKVNDMTDEEIRGLQLGSIVQKAHFKEMFDTFTHQSNVMIFTVNNENNIIVTSGTTFQPNEAFSTFENGYLSNVSSDMSLWLPKEKNTMEDWMNGHYLSNISMQNMTLFIVVPIQERLLALSDRLIDLFVALLVLFVIAITLSQLCNRIFSKSLFELTKATSDLPKRIEQIDDFKWKENQVFEFNFLGLNFESVARKLKQMFLEIKEKNDLLLEKTEQLEASEKKLYELAHFDTLTNLPNRLTFQEDIDKQYIKAKKRKQRFAVVFVDLDEFKQMNDTFGHSGGDFVLRQVGIRLSTFSKKNHRIQAYRISGDEFILLISETNVAEMEKLCEDLMDLFREPLEFAGSPCTVSASLGVSMFPDDGADIKGLLNNADDAMYRQKRAGKSGASFYRDEGNINV